MPGSENTDLELLLYLARALPPGRRLWIRLRSLLDAELSRRLARLRGEQGRYEANIRPGLLHDLRQRLPRATSTGFREAGSASLVERLANIRTVLESGLARPKTVYIWVALSTLTIAALLLSPLQGGGGREAFGIPAVDSQGRHVHPPLILGY